MLHRRTIPSRLASDIASWRSFASWGFGGFPSRAKLMEMISTSFFIAQRIDWKRLGGLVCLGGESTLTTLA